jgi:PilZ domain-containing protein
VRPGGSASHPPQAGEFGNPSIPPLKGVPKIESASAYDMTLRNIILERREKTRKVPDQFAFLQLEQDDGGKVLDISEGGLRFESFAPVRKHSPVHFWFSLNLRERIEGWGELAWTDAGGKSGGLKFLRFSDDGQEQIRDYLARPSPHKVPLPIGARDADGIANVVSRARPEQTTVSSAKKGGAAPSILFPTKADTAAEGHLVPLERHLAALRRQLIRGLWIGACTAGIVTFAAVKFVQYLQERRVPARTSVQMPVQKEPETSAPSITPPAAGAPAKDVFALGSEKKEPPKVRVPATLPAERSAPIGRSKNSLTPDQLWTLVQAGNSTAAAALAELYIKGDGVPQSCAQARVLLLVASEKRNAAAIKRLAALDKEGCPAN